MRRSPRTLLIGASVGGLTIMGVFGMVASVLTYLLIPPLKSCRATLWVYPAGLVRRTYIFEAEINSEKIEIDLDYYYYNGAETKSDFSYAAVFTQFATSSHHVRACGTYLSQSWDKMFGHSGFNVWLPPWLLGVISVLPVIPAVLRRWRRKRVKKKGLCAACGYDLRASGDRCPECGLIREQVSE